MTETDLAKLKKTLTNKRTAKAALVEFFAKNPDEADALYEAGITINNPLLLALLPFLLQFLADRLAKRKTA